MKLFVVLPVVLTILAGCEREPVGPIDSGQVVASLQGSEASSYEGSGLFSAGRDPRTPSRPAFFFLRSTSADGRQGFRLQRPGGELPAAGRYPLGSGSDFTARYERLDGAVREGYSAREGEVEIVSATPDRIVGSFRFVAVRNCTGTFNAMHCVLPSAAEGPTIEIAGSFEAVRAR